KPELPNGCDVPALASALHYTGYDVAKTVLADKSLTKVPFAAINANPYGADASKTYTGDPSTKQQGCIKHVAPIIEAANKYLDEVSGSLTPKDLTGSSPTELLDYVREGIPVIIWTTIDQQEPNFNYSWIVTGSEEKLDVIRNSHTVVLTGFSENEVYVMDPLKGNVAYPKERFFEIYEKAGSHAMIVQ